MSNLDAFLHPVYTEQKMEIVVSDRFVGEDGKPIPFILRSLSNDVTQQIAKRCYVGNGKDKQLDKIQYLNRCLVESCIQPNFKNHDLCVAYGTEDPFQLPQKMLLAKEYERLSLAYMKLNGVDEDESLGEITKNS